VDLDGGGHLAPAPFVVGVARSGTTLLRMMLDAHPAMAIPPESYLVLPFLRGRTPLAAMTAGTFVEKVTSFHTWPDFGLTRTELQRAVESVPHFTIAAGLRAIYRLYSEARGKPRWGDKTPAYGRHLAAIGALLPEARFLHILRDGRAVAASLRGLWFAPGTTIAEYARHWREEILAIRQEQRSGVPYLEVRYEDLVLAPQGTLERLCAFVDLPPHKAMLGYHQGALARLGEVGDHRLPDGRTITRESRLAKHLRLGSPPDGERIEAWRRELSRVEQQEFMEVAGDLLVELGYPA